MPVVRPMDASTFCKHRVLWWNAWSFLIKAGESQSWACKHHGSKPFVVLGTIGALELLVECLTVRISTSKQKECRQRTYQNGVIPCNSYHSVVDDPPPKKKNSSKNTRWRHWQGTTPQDCKEVRKTQKKHDNTKLSSPAPKECKQHNLHESHTVSIANPFFFHI